jgi:hypothetical protein
MNVFNIISTPLRMTFWCSDIGEIVRWFARNQSNVYFLASIYKQYKHMHSPHSCQFIGEERIQSFFQQRWEAWSDVVFIRYVGLLFELNVLRKE